LKGKNIKITICGSGYHIYISFYMASPQYTWKKAISYISIDK